MKNLRFRVEYFFNHSSHGFSNSVTVEAMNIDEAKTKAEQLVKDCYGSKMFKRFSLKTPIIIN